MSLLNLGYGLGGFMQGYNQEQNQQLARQLSQLYRQQIQDQLQQQQQQNQAAGLLFPALLGGGAQTPMPGQASVPQFGGGPFGGGGQAPAPPAAAQPSSPPSPLQFGGGPDLSSYGGAGVNFTGSPGAFIGSSNGGGGQSPLGPRVSASQYGGMAVDPSFGAVLARDPVPQDPGDRFGPPGRGPMASDASLLPEFSSGGSGQYTYDSSGNLIDQATGSPVSSVSSRAATPTTDIPPAAAAPSSPPGGGSGSSAAAAPSLSAGGDTTSVPGGFNAGYQALVNLGVSPDVARGAIQYMAHNESGSNPLAVNPSSGALGRAQWLGSRKAALEQMYGRRPSDAQQATFLQQELLGGESGTLQQLRNATTAKQGYDIWGRSFERPGGAALAQAGVGSGGGVPGSVASLGAGGGGGANDAILQQAMQLIQKGMAPVPESMYGRMSTQQLARQIENANPNADPVVKMLALERGMKLLAPEDRLATQQYMQEHQDTFRVGLALLQSQLTQGRQEARQEGSGPIVTQDGKSYRVGPDNVLHPLTIEGQGGAPATGVSKLGGAGGDLPPPDPSSVKILKSMLEAGLNPPSYMARGKQGQSNLNAAMKEMGEEGKTGGQIAQARGDIAANKASQTNLTRVYDTVKAYAGLADKNIAAAEKMAENTVPTNFGPLLNRWIMSGQTEFGDEDVPGYTMQVITASNELARVLSASTGAAAMTDSARREAAEMLSPYFSAGQFKQAAKVARAEIARRLGELEGGIRNIRERTAAPGTAPGETPGGAQPQPSPGGDQPSTTAAPGEYKTPDDVKAAVDAGQLDRDQALKILHDQFGYE